MKTILKNNIKRKRKLSLKAMERLCNKLRTIQKEKLKKGFIIFTDKRKRVPHILNVLASVLSSLTAADMEASAGLVAGSHNRNELVVIHNHEEVTHSLILVFSF